MKAVSNEIGIVSVGNEVHRCEWKIVENISKQGYSYSTNEGLSCGPFTVQETHQSGFYDNVASKLGLTSKDVLEAHLRSLKRPTNIDDLLDIFSSTIKRDNPTKAILFLVLLSTYTEENQQNIALQAESSSGKSYIPLELASFFPHKDKKIIASASPTAFFHETGTLVDENGKEINLKDRPSKNSSSEEKHEWEKRLRTSRILVDLEQKILIFLDQPHYMLMEKLRSLLSHDQKELEYKITDKTQRFGLRTKNVTIRGYPTIIFCSAKLKLDEQEKTRVFLLSPEVDEEKLLESIYLLGEKHGNRDRFKNLLESDCRRQWLRNRVYLIRTAGIRDVVIDEWDEVCERFLKNHQNLTPRHQRDFPRLISLIKSYALLNWAHRESLPNKKIRANSEDIEAGFRLYNQIAKQNELGLSPHIYEIHRKVIRPNLNPDIGLHRKTIQQEYFRAYHRALPDEKLRREILPSLEAAGLILQDLDPNDRRRRLVYSPDPSPISSENVDELKEENRGNIRGIKEIEDEEHSASRSLSVSEIINQLKNLLPEKFMRSDFVEHAIQLGMNENNADKLFWRLIDEEGRILMDPEGFWRWVN